jgi:hypothetical protein
MDPVCHVEENPTRTLGHFVEQTKLRFGLHREDDIHAEAVNVATTCASQLAETE